MSAARRSSGAKGPSDATRSRKPAGPAEASPLASRFRAVFENSRDAIGISRAGEHLFVNPAYLRLFGFPPGAELAGRPILDIIAPSHRELIGDYIRRRLRGEEAPSVYETRALRADGSEFDMEVTVSQYREDGETLTLAALRDITDRKATEQALAEREATLRQIMDTADVAIFLMDRGGRITHANQRMAVMFRRSMEELVGSEYVDHIHPSEREAGRQKLLALLASSVPSVDVERLYQRRDGSEFWGHLAGQRFQDARGREVGLIGVITDIDTRRRTEETLRKSEERYRGLYHRTPAMLHSIDHEGRLVSVSDEWLRTLGYTRDEVLGRRTTEFLTEASRRYAVETVLPEFFRTGACRDVPYQMVTKTGKVLDVLLSATSETDESGRVIRSLAVIVDVTARKRAEEELRRSEEKFRRLYHETPVMLHSINSDAVLVDVNDHWLKTMGYERHEVIGHTITDFYTEASRRHAVEVVHPAFFRDGAVADVAYQFVKKNGEVLDVLLSATGERDAAGNVVRSRAVIQDVTERKRSELAVNEARELLTRFIRHSPIYAFIKEVGPTESRVLYASENYERMIGTPGSAMTGKTMAELFPPEFAAKITADDWAVVKGGEVLQLDEELGGRSYTTIKFPLELRGRTMLAGYTIDVTERNQVAQALSEARQLYEGIFQGCPMLIALTTESEGRYLAVNAAHERITGYRADEVLGRTVGEFEVWVSPDRAQALRQLREKGSLENLETIFRRRSGELFPALLSMMPIELQGQRCIISILADISGLKQAETLRSESETRYRLLFESATDGIFIMDESGFVDCNRRGAEMYGRPKEEILGRQPVDFAPERQADGRPSAEVGAEKVRAAMDGVPQHFEWRPLRPDGTFLDVEITLNRLEMGGKASLLAIVRDVGERKRAEQERLKTQRIESLGSLAGGIAHDFNNLLQGVFGFISMARITHDQRDRSLAMLEQAEKALHQAVSLTSQLLTFAKGGKPVKNVIRLRQVVEDAVKLALSGSRVVCDLSLPDDLRPVAADAGQIGQVIQNIVLNADQAMPLGGRIALSARNVAASSVVGLPAGLAGDLVEIAIRDEGTGIPREHLARIFDPYFTTKERGSGLGLATSYSIVANHGGALSVASELGRGSTFTIHLPAAGAPPPVAAPPPAAVADRRMRLLVMDDEEIVRSVVGEILGTLGHETVLAEHGEAAVAAYRSALEGGRPFDAVILDLTVRGGMGGAETVRRLREIDPAVKAVASSGYSDDTVLASYREHGFAQFLKKPYVIGELQQVLRTLA